MHISKIILTFAKETSNDRIMITKELLKELANKYGVTLDENRNYPSFSKRYYDAIDRIGWNETICFRNGFGKTCIQTMTGTHYRTHCEYNDKPITIELIESKLKGFVRNI